LTRHLDPTLWHAPAVALEATRRALSVTACELFAAVRAVIAGETSGREELRRVQIQHALDQTQEFFAKIPPINEDEPPSASRVAPLHAIDHLTRLQAQLHPESNVLRVLAEERVRPMAAQGRAILELGETGLSGRAPADWLAQMERAAAASAKQRRQARPIVLKQTADGQDGPAHALEIRAPAAANHRRTARRTGGDASRTTGGAA
jgi:phosphate:Na+ symporter